MESQYRCVTCGAEFATSLGFIAHARVVCVAGSPKEGMWNLPLEELKRRMKNRILLLEKRLSEIQEHIDPQRHSNTRVELAVARKRFLQLEARCV